MHQLLRYTHPLNFTTKNRASRLIHRAHRTKPCRHHTPGERQTVALSLPLLRLPKAGTTRRYQMTALGLLITVSQEPAWSPSTFLPDVVPVNLSLYMRESLDAVHSEVVRQLWGRDKVTFLIGLTSLPWGILSGAGLVVKQVRIVQRWLGAMESDGRTSPVPSRALSLIKEPLQSAGGERCTTAGGQRGGL
ncbi:hypothetical protein AAFF_G00300420 [Aldrovandia affinis]|uniref:Uncharacterized protein n=1 Tax=Aldrovandia affinis TaxID=143900 RepID=A0AAD7WRL9_9TELE|nr:hypothetical protein AAFF_G00300420 [Aldrovandia affinis]